MEFGWLCYKTNMLGIFDSGIGGLSIWQHIREIMPQSTILYLADQKWAPYGNLSTSEIRTRGFMLTDFLQKLGATTIVVACNTATVTVTIEDLRQSFPDLIFVGVEPPVKKLVELSQSKPVALLATQPTCNSSRLQQLIDTYAQGVKVEVVAATEWARIVEQGMPEPETSISIKYCMSSLSGSIGTVGLGCTHYSFLRPTLQQLFPKINFIDVSEAVAHRTKQVYNSRSTVHSKYRFFTTGNPHRFEKSLLDLLSVNSPVEFISL